MLCWRHCLRNFWNLNVFSFWDRIFGTLVVDDPKKVRYGIDTLINDEDKVDDVKFQLNLPFRKDALKKTSD